MKIVELQAVGHRFGNQAVINNIFLGFEQNKTTAIIGKSGSGKSTLLQFINGLIKPSEGLVHVFGKPLDYSNISSVRLNIGYMVQGTGLFPHLTIAENISIAGKLTDPPIQSSQRVSELMLSVGLPDLFKNKFPYQLSGGEQQRVGICRALFLNPPLLLMDEPFGALDPITRQEIQHEIIKLQQAEPRTILLVTHDMREANMLADYILVLDNGEVQQFDKTASVLNNPANDRVKKLIESSLS